MGQIKIYGIKERLTPIKETLSDVIHSCLIDAFEYPHNKKFHRFFPMEQENLYFESNRTMAYTIIEISIFEGRSVEAKKRLINLLIARIDNKLKISPQDIEITIFETPKHNWGIRGLPGDELALHYKVNI